MVGLRRLWSCYTSCAVLLLTAQLLALLLGTSIVVGTGFVRVPFISDRAAPRPGAAGESPGFRLLEERWQAALAGLPEVRLELTEAEVNQLLAELGRREPTPMHAMKAELRFGQVRVRGEVPGPLPIGAQVWGRIEVRLGVMQFVTEKVFLGDLPVPEALAQPFSTWASEQMRRPLTEKKLPLSVEQVELREGRVTVRGRLPESWRPEQ